MWHLTCYTWQVTHDMWQMTSDTWWGMTILSKGQLSSSNGLEFMMSWRLARKDQSVREGFPKQYKKCTVDSLKGGGVAKQVAGSLFVIIFFPLT